MNVVDADATDFPAIEDIHKGMGMDYQLPDLNSPLFFVKKVVKDEQGRVLGACFLRLSAECYLWLRPDCGPRQKMDAMEAMQPEVLEGAWEKGIDDIEARIPGDLERRFQKRLKQLGWSRDREDWHPWSRSTTMEAA